jgi:putative PIN family toxin of toxin-antitoxin system
MRVLLDSNVYLSFLLNPAAPNAPQTCVVHVLDQRISCIVSRSILDELKRNVLTKPYLRDRISPNRLDSFLTLIDMQVGIAADPPGKPLRATRDPGDDFVIALALHHDVHIITGDKDLLVLDPIGKMRIISPSAFAALIAPDLAEPS